MPKGSVKKKYVKKPHECVAEDLPDGLVSLEYSDGSTVTLTKEQFDRHWESAKE